MCLGLSIQICKRLISNTSIFHPLEVVGRVSETQHEVGGKFKLFNPLSPHDALKHHFTS